MYCRFCGKQIPDNSQFCEHCGRQLNTQGQEGWRPASPNDGRWRASGGDDRDPFPPPRPSQSRRNGIIAACVGGAILVFALVAALVLLLAPGKDPGADAPADGPAEDAGTVDFSPAGYYLGGKTGVYLDDGSYCAGLPDGVYRFTPAGAERLLEGNFNGYGLCIGQGELLAVRRESDEEHILVELDLRTGEADELYSCPADTVLAGKLGDTLYLLSPSQGIWGMDLISIAADGTQTLVVSEMGSASCGPFGLLVEGYRSDVGPQVLYVLTEGSGLFLLSESCLASSQAGGMLLVWECNASADNNYIWDEITLVDYSGNGGVQRLSIGCSGASALPMDMFAQGSSIQSFGGEANILWVDYAGEYWFKAPLTEEGDALTACFPDGDALYGYCYADRNIYRLTLDMDAGKVEMEAAGTLPEGTSPLAVTNGTVYYAYFDGERAPAAAELSR